MIAIRALVKSANRPALMAAVLALLASVLLAHSSIGLGHHDAIGELDGPEAAVVCLAVLELLGAATALRAIRQVQFVGRRHARPVRAARPRIEVDTSGARLPLSRAGPALQVFRL